MGEESGVVGMDFVLQQMKYNLTSLYLYMEIQAMLFYLGFCAALNKILSLLS